MIKHSITLYSFGKKFASRQYSIEDCIIKAKELGAEGIELVASQMVPGYPWPAGQWLDYFKDLCEKHQMDPVCYSAYVDMGLRSDRDLNENEIIEATINDLEIAHKLGFKLVRSQHAMSPGILEKMIPYAEKFNLHLAIEMHHPHEPSTPVWKEFLDVIRRNKTDRIGIVPDMSSFQQYPVSTYRGFIIRTMKLLPETVDYVIAAHNRWEEKEIVRSKVKEIENGDAVDNLVDDIYYRYPHPTDFDGLRSILPYSQYIHGKFFHIDENGVEEAIPYNEILNIITESGFNGYICTEFEGNVYDESLDEEEQIRRHIKMQKRILGR